MGALREITPSQSFQQMPIMRMPPQLQSPPQKSPSPEAASTTQAPKESLGSPRSTPSSVRISKDSSPPAQVEKKARQTRSKPTPILMKRPLSSVNSTVRRRYYANRNDPYKSFAIKRMKQIKGLKVDPLRWS